MSYVDFKYYVMTFGGTIITAENAPKAFRTASESVDALTFCRIVRRGIDQLSEFQREIVKRVVCALAEWQTENEDILDNPLSSYSINGVSSAWGIGAGVSRVNGVMIPSRIYADLLKTGLCYPGV